MRALERNDLSCCVAFVNDENAEGLAISQWAKQVPMACLEEGIGSTARRHTLELQGWSLGHVCLLARKAYACMLCISLHFDGVLRSPQCSTLFKGL